MDFNYIKYSFMAAITTAAIGVATAAYTVYNAEEQKADAKKAMENLEVPELENPYENMRVSTMGSDLLREEGQRRTASVIDGLRGGGARNMMSAIPKIVAMNNDINQQARKEIDDQMLDRERLIAGYGDKQNDYEERRYQGELQGYGQMYYQGQQQMWNGVRTGLSSLGSLGRSLDGMPQAKSISNLKQQGIQPVSASNGLDVGLTQNDFKLQSQNNFNLDKNLGYLSNINLKN